MSNSTPKRSATPSKEASALPLGRAEAKEKRVKKPLSPIGSLDSLRILDLAKFTAQSLQTPFPTPFGSSVIHTKNGSLLTRQVNHGRQNLDPTAHAEVHAIRAACRKLKSMSLKGYTLYTTCEPCPMCMAASLWAELDRVVYGATIGDASKYFNQIYTLSKQMVKKSDLFCEVVGPVERSTCGQLFEACPYRRSGLAPAKTSKN